MVAQHAVERAFRDELNPHKEFASQHDLKKKKKKKNVVERNVTELFSQEKLLMNEKDEVVSYFIKFYYNS